MDINYDTDAFCNVDLSPSVTLAYADGVALSDAMIDGRQVRLRVKDQKEQVADNFHEALSELGVSSTRNMYRDYHQVVGSAKDYKEHAETAKQSEDTLSWVTDKVEYAKAYVRGAYECEGSIYAPSKNQLQVALLYQKENAHYERFLDCIELLDIPYNTHIAGDGVMSVELSGTKKAANRITSEDKVDYLKMLNPAIKTPESTEYEI